MSNRKQNHDEVQKFFRNTGIVIGILVATVRSTWDQNSENMHAGAGKTVLGFFNALCKIYLTVIRGTPVVIQLMIMSSQHPKGF